MDEHAEQNARVVDQFARQAERYAALIQKSRDSSLPVLLGAMQPRLSERLLDVGCGTGRFALTMAPFVAHVTGVDLTTAMLDQARAAQAATELSNLEWREADVTALPFADGAFDLVTSRAMLHHVHEPAHVLAEMRRVCAPGGRIMVNDLAPSAAKAASLNAIELLRDPSHARAMTSDELRALGRSCGLAEILVHTYETTLPLEPVLDSSFPRPGIHEKLRALYRMDAEHGANSLGVGAHYAGETLLLTYPMALLVWRLA